MISGCHLIAIVAWQGLREERHHASRRAEEVRPERRPTGNGVRRSRVARKPRRTRAPRPARPQQPRIDHLRTSRVLGSQATLLVEALDEHELLADALRDVSSQLGGAIFQLHNSILTRALQGDP